MPENLYDVIISYKKELLKQELAALRYEIFKLHPIIDHEIFAERFNEFELCSDAVTYLTGICWQTYDDQKLLQIIDYFTDRGTFLSNLIRWTKSRADQDIRDTLAIIKRFSLEMRESWQDQYKTGHEEPFEHGVARRVELSLRRFRREVCRTDAGLVFDKAIPISLLSYILGHEAITDLYLKDALLILDRLNFEGILIYHAVKWVEENGLSYLRDGESYVAIAARFADFIVSNV